MRLTCTSGHKKPEVEFQLCRCAFLESGCTQVQSWPGPGKAHRHPRRALAALLCKGGHRFLFSRIGIGINHFGPGIGIGQYLTLSHIGISQLNPIELTGIINFQTRQYHIIAQVACYSLWPTSSLPSSSQSCLVSDPRTISRPS